MKKIVIVFVALLWAFTANSQAYYTYFTAKVLRIDLIRSGNFEKEFLSNDEIIQEPYWAGSHFNLVDTFNNGNYKFQVLDSATSKLIYSRAYSSLFAEWKYTAEAKKSWRSFSETVIMPYPINTVKVDFYKLTKENVWQKEYSQYVNPKDKFICNKQRFPAQGYEIHHGGEPARALDVVLLSEGYSENELQKFFEDAQRFKDYLFNCQPFDSLKTKINLWIVPMASIESGTDYPETGDYKNTLLNSHFSTFGVERYLNTSENKKIRDVASNAPYDQICILVNSNRYGGAGFYNFYSIVTSDNTNSNFVLVHEFGHAMAGLADEYQDDDAAVEGFYNLKKEPLEPNITTLVNFGSKWKSMVKKGTIIPTKEMVDSHESVGAFEGGGYLAKGIYRPCYDCTMRSVRYNYFCPVCKKAIIDRVNFYAK